MKRHRHFIYGIRRAGDLGRGLLAARLMTRILAATPMSKRGVTPASILSVLPFDIFLADAFLVSDGRFHRSR